MTTAFYARGPKGDTGPKGDKGDVGDTGPQGDKGDVGPAGPRAHPLLPPMRPIAGLNTAVTATVAAGSSAAAVTVPVTDATKLRVCAGTLALFSDDVYLNLASGLAVAGNGSNRFDIEFWTNSPTVKVYFRCDSAADIWVMVDDMLITPGWLHIGAGSQPFTLTITKTAQRQKVRVGIPRNTPIQAVGLEAGSVIGPSAVCPQVAVIGDSLIQGQLVVQGEPGGISAGALAGELAQITGWDVWTQANSGSGYLAQGGPGDATGPYGSPARMAALATLPVLDAVIVTSSVNDLGVSGYVESTVVSAATSMWTAVKMARPSTPLIVLGLAPGTSADATYLAKWNSLNNALKTAAAANPSIDAFIDWRNPNVVYGTGNSSAPAGNGNADVFISGDGSHPTHAGWRFLAQYLAQKLRGLYA